MSTMRLPRGSCWLLVAIAVAMVLGHICALPFHAHAGAITTHAGHGSHPVDRSTDEDATHAASCDADRTAVGVNGVAVLAPIGTVPGPILPSGRHLVETDGSVIAGSPPLFLLHAVLLI